MEEKSSKAKTGIDNSDIIVIGLTGPFGSGCSTFAKFFDKFPDDNSKISIIEYLKDKGIKNRFKRVDKEIYKFYGLLNDIENVILTKYKDKITKQEIEVLKDRILETFKERSISVFIEKRLNKKVYLDKEVIEHTKARVFSELKVLLEERETLNAFIGETSLINKYLNVNNLRNHHFRRISVSDIIVFMTILHFNDFSYDKLKVYNHKTHGGKPIGKDKIESIKKYREIINKYKISIEKDVVKKIGKKGNNIFRYYYNLFSKVSTNLNNNNGDLTLIKDAMKVVVEKIHDAKKHFRNQLKLYYRELMQDFGDNIRRCGDPYDYLTKYEERNVKNSKLVAKDIDTKYTLIREVEKVINLLSVEAEHKVFIVDALRNPYEVLFLRERFNNFYLISVYADKKVRFQRREESFGAKYEEYFNKNDKRDKGEYSKGIKALYGQNVTECSRLADIAINNYVAEEISIAENISNNKRRWGEKKILPDNKIEKYSLQEFGRKIIRAFALIIDKGCTKPNDDEHLMNQAYAMAMKSNCISRQVGAVIVDKDGYIIGAGWNDVGEGHISCGLIEVKDLKSGRFGKYMRIIKEGISNEDNIFKIDDKKLHPEHCICFREKISLSTLLKNIENKEVYKKIDKDDINDILVKQHENCRALHAEENAILQSSRRGGMGLDGGCIYVTTFPCPLCAKKIMQVGIKEVVFDDPYPSDLSEIFLGDGNKKVVLRHFEGVKPLGYFKLFKPDHDQKEWQYLEVNNLVEKYTYDQ